MGNKAQEQKRLLVCTLSQKSRKKMRVASRKGYRGTPTTVRANRGRKPKVTPSTMWRGRGEETQKKGEDWHIRS